MMTQRQTKQTATEASEHASGTDGHPRNDDERNEETNAAQAAWFAQEVGSTRDAAQEHRRAAREHRCAARRTEEIMITRLTGPRIEISHDGRRAYNDRGELMLDLSISHDARVSNAKRKPPTPKKPKEEKRQNAPNTRNQ